MRHSSPLLLPILLAAALAGCDSQPRTAPVPDAPHRVEERRGGGNPSAAGMRQKQADFLNRIREADPQHRTIERALLNEQNELGLILSRTVEMDKIPALMRTMLTQMAKEFPGEDLTIIAYAPSNPPRKIGTAHLDARSRDMTYTPAG